MSTTEINWRHNCLTVGVHDGRPEAIWNLPLSQALMMYEHEGLKQIVVARIFQDAMQMVEHGDEPRMPDTWAKVTAELAEENFIITFATQLHEIVTYYSSASYKRDVEGVIERIKLNKLNPHYAPLHGHDTVNMTCRILGVSCSRKASATG